MFFVTMMGMISIVFLHNYHSHQESSTETMNNAVDDIHNQDPATMPKNIHNEKLFFRQKFLAAALADADAKEKQQQQQEQYENKLQQPQQKQQKQQLEKLKAMSDVTKFKTTDADGVDKITVSTSATATATTPSATTINTAADVMNNTAAQQLLLRKNRNNNKIKLRRQKYKENNKKREEEDERLNIILFYADDWTMKVLGKLDPHQIVKTPNIDEMANNGMIFTNNCVTTSVCWVSRSTLCTGTYSNIHKHTLPFSDATFETMNWNETLYPKMKNNYDTNLYKNGYYTGLFGKWHKLEIGDEIQEAFHEQKVYYGKHWEERDGQQRHVTDLNRDDSIEFLDKWNDRRRQEHKTHNKNQQPFFLTVSFFATHARDGGGKGWEFYQPHNNTRTRMYPDWSKDIPLPKTATEQHFKQLPPFLANFGNEGRMRWRNRYEPKDYQKNIKDMYAMATEVDDAVGTIIQHIKNLQVYNNTVLIFTTDNGNMHGEHGLAEKWYPFEESIRVPLVIQDPRMPTHRHGTTSDAWTLNVDLAPTILGAANIEPASFMQGRDISDLYLLQPEEEDKAEVDVEAEILPKKGKHHKQQGKNEASTSSTSSVLSNNEIKKKVHWRTDWFYEFNLGQNSNASDHPWPNYIDASFALITDHWKYVIWPQHDGYEQLFHRSMDPYEEWDLLNKLLRNQTRPSSSSSNNTSDGDGNSVMNIQTTEKIYQQMKIRFAILKQEAQGGNLI